MYLNLDFKGKIFSYNPYDLYGLRFLNKLALARFLYTQFHGEMYTMDNLVTYFEINYSTTHNFLSLLGAELWICNLNSRSLIVWGHMSAKQCHKCKVFMVWKPNRHLY